MKRNASNNGNNDSKQMSIGSENHDLIGMALFGKQRYAPGELSMMNIYMYILEIMRRYEIKMIIMNSCQLKVVMQTYPIQIVAYCR